MAHTRESTTAAAPADPHIDPVTGLYRMSRTAGVGLQDYAEVNSLAVASLVCGMASWLIYFESLLYFIPALAVALGVWGLARIIGSSRTQTGILIALLGIGLGAGTVIYKGVQDRVIGVQNAADTAEIKNLIAQLSEHVRDGNTDALRPLFSKTFHDRVKPDVFRQRIDGLKSSDIFGNVEKISDNGIIEIERASGDSQRQAATMLFFDVKRPGAEPGRTRLTATFISTADGWRILNISELFPATPDVKQAPPPPTR